MLPNLEREQEIVVRASQRELRSDRRAPAGLPLRARVGAALISAGVALGGERREPSRQPRSGVASPAA